ncbi:unnamed protein product, partial [Vitis vinifera]
MKSCWKKRELTFLILYALLFYIIIIRRSLQISHDYSHKVFGLRPGWVPDQLNKRAKAMKSCWKKRELTFLILYALLFYIIIIRRSLQISHDYSHKVFGLRPGWVPDQLNDVSDAQWRNFRGKLHILTVVFGIFAFVANMLRAYCQLKAKGMAVVWLLISLIYLAYLHGACIIFVLSIASANFLLVKIFARTKYFSSALWTFNLFFLIYNRIHEGYSFSTFGQHWAYLDNFRGAFRWHICFNFVILRMISFGYDFHWAHQDSHFDQKIFFFL